MKKTDKVTIYDVSREAGVSLATVSRVINGSAVVREATRQKVLKVIEELDFKPNEVARGLAKSKSTTIAVVFPQSLFANVKEMISGIGDAGRYLNYNIIMYTTDNIGDDDTVKDVVERLVKSRVDGVVLFNDKNIERTIKEIKKYNIPITVIGRKIDDDEIGSIYFDVEGATFEIVDQYLSEGKDRILYVSPQQNLILEDEVMKGIDEAYAKHGLTFDKQNILHCSSHYEHYYPKFVEYFKDKDFDLVLCGYDKDGVGVVNAEDENGKHVPEDTEVIGFFNTSYSIISRPMLSSLNVPVYDMGAIAVRMLTKIMGDEALESKQFEVKYNFIKRDSTK